MPEFENHFAKNLSRLRAEKGLTREVISVATGISERTLGRYERGESLPRIDDAMRLAGVLSVPLVKLLFDI